MFCKHRVILSVDGCGFKGIIPLKIMSYLHESIQKMYPEIDVTSYVDLFTSTSASSIFTGALMIQDEEGRSKYTPNDLLNFYLNKGNRMFSKNVGLDAENSNYPLSFVLDHFFGPVRLKDFKHHYLFYSYNQTHDSIVTFSKNNDRYYNLSLSTVMQACTVDADNFPPLKLGSISLVDASFVIKNPAMLSYNYMRLLYPSDHIVLISIGFKNQSGVCNVLKTTVPQADVHQQLKEVQSTDPFLHYFRYEPELVDLPVDMDETSAMNQILLDLTDDYIVKNQDNFEELLKLMLIRAA